MTKEEVIKRFDPNGPSSADGGIFGLPFDRNHASIVLIPVPWDVTVSFSAGAALGPQTIFNASGQVDLYDPLVKNAWHAGIFLEKIPSQVEETNKILREKAVTYLECMAQNQPLDAIMPSLAEINEGCGQMVSWVYEQSQKVLDEGKIPVLVGGDHSTPLGLIKAIANKHEGVGLLQIDAHCDLRKAYEGFKYSHASIMYNALEETKISKLVQVGIRDWCEEEMEYIKSSAGKISTFFDHKIKEDIYHGVSWKAICAKVIEQLPQKVYVSFDIDGLDPHLCPGTGTPVPGGLDYQQVIFLFAELVRSGKEIVGFDLNEVAPGEGQPDESNWNGNVGARILYRLCNLTAVSNKLLSWH